MSAFFVTGAGTEIGKTYVSCALLSAWRAAGVRARALKPVVSGYQSIEREKSDPGLMLAALGRTPSANAIAAIAPWRYAAPLAPHLAARAEGLELPYDELVRFCRAGLGAGPLLIEGAGGVMAPLSDTRTNLDLMQALEMQALFVSGSYLGAVSHALTGIECIERRGLEIAAVIVSETPDGVGLDATCAMLARQRPDLHILSAPRAPLTAPPAWACALAARLLD